MAQRYKTRAELESKVIRVSLGQYALLAEISRRAGVTMAEALQLVIEHRAQESVTMISPALQVTPVFRVTDMPMLQVTDMPVLRVTPMVQVAPVAYIAVNDWPIKPKIKVGG